MPAHPTKAIIAHSQITVLTMIFAFISLCRFRSLPILLIRMSAPPPR
jgi:hypothetical protein